jgi:hypothetical protein
MIKNITSYIKNMSKKPGYASLLIYLTPDNSPENSPVTSPIIPTRTPPNTPVTSPSTTTTTPASTPGGTSGNTSGNITEVFKGETVNTQSDTVGDKLGEGVKTEEVTGGSEVPVQGVDFKETIGSKIINGNNTSGNISENGGTGSGDLFSPMDQFEIHPFLGNLFGLNYTPLGLITNILVYIGLAVSFIFFFYIYGSFKDNIKLNG